MQAIIVTGGKQYNVSEGDTLFIEKLDVNAGDSVVFDQVLAIVDGENTKFGAPVVEGAKVDATVVKNGKGKKIRIFKYKAKKDYRKKQGHRQPYTLVEITSIAGKAAPAAAAKEEAPVEEKKAVKKPSLKSMKKAELIEFAKENNIEINEKATNAVMIETIEAALK